MGFLSLLAFLNLHIENVMYFSVFSTKQLNGPLKCFAKCLLFNESDT